MESASTEKHICLTQDEADMLSYNNKMLKTIINSSEAGVYVTDFNTGEIIFANDKTTSFLGTSTPAEDLVGKICWKALNGEDATRCSFCAYKKLIDENGELLPPYSWERFFDTYGVWVKITNQAIRWFDGRLAQITTFHTITEIKEMQNRLADLAYTDQLLHIKNRFKFEQDMMEKKEAPSIVVFDILSLQRVNDAYGRELGDKLLIAVRDWISGQNIPYSELYRIGSDEFCLTVEQADGNAISLITELIHKRFSEPWILYDNNMPVQVFLGVTIGVIMSDFVQNSESLLNLIERTLKSAKVTKKTVFYNFEADEAFKRRLAMEMCLKKSVREGMKGFEAHYQPIVNTNGEWLGLEALCRWNCEGFGSVPPSIFIPEAERLSLIDKIGLWMLETAIKRCKELCLDRLDGFVLDVNVSSIQFSDDKLAYKILEIMSSNDFPGECLCIEITESTQFTFNELSLNTLEKLRDNGVLIALDDFGTGYSNFNNLKKLPVDILKIEKDFISDIEGNDYLQFLFHAIAELAYTAGKKIVAEGVETSVQAEILAESGTDYMQGYYFSRPIPSGKLENHKFKV